MARGRALGFASKASEPLSRLDRLAVASVCIVGAVLLYRSLVAPLSGYDTNFRWDFLPQRILATGHFGYYPPLRPADFRNYFYTDGIPPMVAFSYWWIYAAVGKHLPAITSVLVAAQFGSALAFSYGAAASLFSRRAGVLTAAMLCGCPLFFNAFVMGQETGLTALGMAALLYFVVTARAADDSQAMVSAGLAAALCALSREYGWIAAIAGAIAILWRGLPAKQAGVFAATAIAAAAPWYLRNWFFAGNPVYSLPLPGFAVNPVYDGLMQFYKAYFAPSHWTGEQYGNTLRQLLVLCGLPLVAGIVSAGREFRRRGYLAVISLLLVLVWIQSIGYTSGGVGYSMRVLSPAMVTLALAGAGALAGWIRQPARYGAILALAGLLQIWTMLQGAMYPFNPLDIGPRLWLTGIRNPNPPPVEFQSRNDLLKVMPRGSRVLTESPTLHAAMAESGVDVVPVWSPEVMFIFTETAGEATRRLQALGIYRIAFYRHSLNSSYLEANSQLYRELRQRWAMAARLGDVMELFVPRKQ